MRAASNCAREPASASDRSAGSSRASGWPLLTTAPTSTSRAAILPPTRKPSRDSTRGRTSPENSKAVLPLCGLSCIMRTGRISGARSGALPQPTRTSAPASDSAATAVRRPGRLACRCGAVTTGVTGLSAAATSGTWQSTGIGRQRFGMGTTAGRAALHHGSRRPIGLAGVGSLTVGGGWPDAGSGAK
ncbi:hypothetical protein CBM2606_A60133 [Cupriavidus taiwanensis]|nr:hypothetical protein CBM2606_A60133 [Cupriavidus taiwanensis]